MLVELAFDRAIAQLAVLVAAPTLDVAVGHERVVEVGDPLDRVAAHDGDGRAAEAGAGSRHRVERYSGGARVRSGELPWVGTLAWTWANARERGFRGRRAGFRTEAFRDPAARG